MYAYPCGSDLGHWGTTTTTQANSLYAAWGALVNGYSNVIGIDVTNEAEGQGPAAGLTWAQTLARITELTNTLRSVTSKPLTHSRTAAGDVDWGETATGELASISDFNDFHVYYTPGVDDAKPLFAKWWGNRAVVFGEFGSPTSDTSTARTARFNAIKALAATDARFNGGLAWDIASSSYGLFDPSTGAARTDVTVPFQTFPTSR